MWDDNGYQAYLDNLKKYYFDFELISVMNNYYAFDNFILVY